MSKTNYSHIKNIIWPKRVVWPGGPPVITPNNVDLVMQFAKACGAQLEIDMSQAIQGELERALAQCADLDRRATEYAALNDKQAARIAMLETENRILRKSSAEWCSKPHVVAWASYHGDRVASITHHLWIAMDWKKQGGTVRELCLAPWEEQ